MFIGTKVARFVNNVLKPIGKQKFNKSFKHTHTSYKLGIWILVNSSLVHNTSCLACICELVKDNLLKIGTHSEKKLSNPCRRCHPLPTTR